MAYRYLRVDLILPGEDKDEVTPAYTQVGDGQTSPPVVKVRVGTDRIWKRFSELSTGTLQGRPTNFSDPAKVEDAVQRIRDAEADKADQRREPPLPLDRGAALRAGCDNPRRLRLVNG